MSIERKACRHCAKNKAVRPKSLCWGCWTRHRDLYPSTSKFARRGSGFAYSGPPPEPTTARPGTEGKVAVLEARAQLGVDLFHELDAALPAD